MKIISGMAMGLVFLAGLTHCKEKEDSNPVNCESDAQKVAEARSRFSRNLDKASCEAYKKELSDFLRGCPTYYGSIEKGILEEFANEPCE